MAKALKVVGMVIGGIAIGIATLGVGSALAAGFSLSAAIGTAAATTIAGIGISAGALFAASAGLLLGSSLLAPKPKAPAVSPDTSQRLLVSAELRTGRKMIAGSTACATDLRDQEYSDGQSVIHRFVVVASHRMRAIREIWFDDKLAWSTGGGVTSEYAGYLAVTPVLEGSAGNAILISARMGLARRYTGCAYVYFRFKVTGNNSKATSPFASAIPSRVTIIGDGIPVYDPRLDSTVPGGSGPQRANDQSTWSTGDAQCRNPALVMLTRFLGWRINGKLAIGQGIPASRIDLPSFMTAANLCDEPVGKAAGGTEHRYRCDGIFSENEDPTQVNDRLKAAMNAVLDDVDGKIRVTVLHNDLAVPAGDLTTDDVLGDFSWVQNVPLTDTVNIVRGSYIDPSTTALYQLVDYPDVRIDSPDGIDRPQTVNFDLVQSASQAQRLAKQRLQRMQYGGTFTAVFQATAWRYQKGDVIRFTFFPLGWSNKLFRIADMAIQVDGTVPMMLREEHPAIYAWDATDAPPVTGAAPTTYDPALWPLVQGITEVGDQVALIFADGIITHGREKRNLVLQWNGLESQLLALDARCDALGSPSDLAASRADAVAAYYGLAATLSALSPAWDDVNSDTPVDAAALNTQWAATQNKIDILAAAISGRPGAAGAPGLNNATVTIYQRATTAPTLPSAPVTYTFASGAISGLNNGWSMTIPAGSTPLYVSQAVASAAGATDTIAAGEWASPVVQSQNGADGSSGLNSKALFIYQRAASAPALPTGPATYVFSAQTLSYLNNGWQPTIPSGTLPIYVSTASALSTTDVDTIAPGEWAAVTILAQNGDKGEDAISAAFSATSFSVSATYAGVTKDGQLPKTSTLSVKRGTTDVTGSCAVTVTPSNGTDIAASYSAGVLSLTKADVAGYVDVAVTLAGAQVSGSPFRLSIARQKDAAPPPTPTSGGGIVDSGVASSSFNGPSNQSSVIQANASGQLIFSLSATYTPFYPGSGGSRNMTVAACAAYRVAGSGSGWSYSGAVTGSFASNDGLEPVEGSVTITDQVISGLTAGALYEVGGALRKSGGTAVSSQAYGNYAVRQ